MADLFSTTNARDLLKNKFVFMLGDSNMRASYKDLVFLLTKNAMLDLPKLRKRGEESFYGDKLIKFSGLIKGRQYEEGREFMKFGVHVEYHFITKCYNPSIVDFLERIKTGNMKAPDVMVMNSCLWDVCRWGPTGVDMYKENMQKLMKLLDDCLPKTTLFIWMTSTPISSTIRGGLIVKQIDFIQDLLRFDIMEGNLFCRQLLVSHGYDVLDSHYHLRMHIHRRLPDGIHYGPGPMRLLTNLLLTHICLSWSVKLPGNSNNAALRRVKAMGFLKTSKDEVVELPEVPACLLPAPTQNTVDTANDQTPKKKKPSEPNKPKPNAANKPNVANKPNKTNKQKRFQRVTQTAQVQGMCNRWEGGMVNNFHARPFPWAAPLQPWAERETYAYEQPLFLNDRPHYYGTNNRAVAEFNRAANDFNRPVDDYGRTMGDFGRGAGDFGRGAGGPLRHNRFYNRTRPY